MGYRWSIRYGDDMVEAFAHRAQALNILFLIVLLVFWLTNRV